MKSYPITPHLQVVTVSVYEPDGFLTVGVDGEAAISAQPPAEAHHPLGLIARPVDSGTDGSGNVSQAQACTVLRLTEENDDSAILLGDPRVTPHVPKIADPGGGVILYEPSLGPDLARVEVNRDGTHGITVHVPAGAKVTLEVAGGPSITIDPAFVNLGAPTGGQPVVIDNGNLAAFFSSVVTALAALGQSVALPAAYKATKVNAV